MRGGQLYNYNDPEVYASLKHANQLCERLNRMNGSEPEYRALLEELIPGLPKSVTITPPLHADHGHGIRLGENAFVNYNATFLDSAYITIGDYTLIGPNCSFFTPQHPFHFAERRNPVETGRPITIGHDCWLGGNVTVLPGVTIGDYTIIGAGSVVTHDIPSGVIAAGNPCRVIRENK